MSNLTSNFKEYDKWVKQNIKPYMQTTDNTNPPECVSSIKAEFGFDIDLLANEIAKLRGDI